MTYVKWTFIIIFWLLVAAFLHYTLPQHDIARITDTYEKRIDVGDNRWFWAQADVGTDGTVPNRDVFFIQARLADGDVMVYRNEDTGWGWPPYFKFNTSNLQAEAADLRSTAADPVWVAIKHYGWRAEVFTIFPNAISVRTVAGPDATVIPWTTIVILIVLAAAGWALWVRWRRFHRDRLAPALGSMGERLGDGGGRLRRMLGRPRH